MEFFGCLYLYLYLYLYLCLNCCIQLHVTMHGASLWDEQRQLALVGSRGFITTSSVHKS